MFMKYEHSPLIVFDLVETITKYIMKERKEKHTFRNFAF